MHKDVCSAASTMHKDVCSAASTMHKDVCSAASTIHKHVCSAASTIHKDVCSAASTIHKDVCSAASTIHKDVCSAAMHPLAAPTLRHIESPFRRLPICVCKRLVYKWIVIIHLYTNQKSGTLTYDFDVISRKKKQRMYKFGHDLNVILSCCGAEQRDLVMLRRRVT
jgi:hypothetical protein